MKYVLVTGGVISGIGKGVIASSIGTILKANKVTVTSIKIDPYINIDAGTFSPYEHGEVFVLDDGGEVDLDLGNYERFLDVTLHRDNNITTGKIYQNVITKERRGDYLGKTVQVVPHITDAIQEWVERVAQVPVDNDAAEVPQVCIIELGGTIGDIEGMPFVEAFRYFQFRVSRENFCCVHVSLLPEPKGDEQKTKPTQNSVRELRGLGLVPDIICARSATPLQASVRNKISNFCHVPPEQVYGIHDVSSIYRVPLLLDDEGLGTFLVSRLQLRVGARAKPRKALAKWKELADRHDRLHDEVVIALVGKYTRLEDAYASVIKALRHAALAANNKLVVKYVEAANLEDATQQKDPVKFHEAWQFVCSAHGILIPGGFGERGVEGKIKAAHWARTNKRPFLGICLGFQCAAIELARGVLGWDDAHSTEVKPDTKHPVIVEMPEHNPGQLGGTMRLGKRKTIFNAANSVLRTLYGNVESVEERHRHRYEVNPEHIDALEQAGMKFVGRDESGKRMEIMELEGHPFYVGVQYHPEYISRPLNPSRPYLGLVLAATGKLTGYLSRGCRMSPRGSALSDSDFSDEEVASYVRLQAQVRTTNGEEAAD